MDGRKTPLYDEHVKLGGKIVNYAGWLLPVQYEGLIPEHEAVRNKAGLFDVSHMGAVKVSGKEAEKFLDHLLTNDISKMADEQVIYTFMCYPDGGVVDDLLTYKFGENEYFLVINAANVEKDYEWIVEQQKSFDVTTANESDETSILALQGPEAVNILQKLVDIDLSQIKPFYLKRNVNVAGVNCMISRTGYTGEDGFEIYVDNEGVHKIWAELMAVGEGFGLKPTGLGCRDTLRFEATLPLYGQEISDKISPLEGGLKFFVKLKKESDFIGKDALVKANDEGLKRKMVGFEMVGRGIPRDGYEIQKDGKVIGHVTTGYMSPTLKKSIGNALLEAGEAEIGNEIDIIIRNKPAKAVVRDRKFLANR
ncbi:MAG: glycine cleavage system aminomethyltransferase GcvT [Tissierellaceae bacterium]